MDTTLPTGRRGQIVALGVTLIAILALWLLIVSPVAGFYFDRADELLEHRRVEQHMEQLVAARQGLLEQAANLGDAAPAHNLLDGSSIPVATAALQGIVQEVASASGATLTSVESLPGENGAGYRRVSIKLAVTTSWPILINFLAALQQSDTPMAIDDLQIHASTQGGQSLQAGSAGAPSGATPQLFDAAFTIHAPASTDSPPPSSDRPAGDRPAMSDRPVRGKPAVEEPGVGQPVNNEPPADALPSDTATPDTAAPDATPADTPADDAPAQEKPK
jgi:general secretion pathway protein M